MNQELIQRRVTISHSKIFMSSKSFIGTPKPLDFEAFIPWICAEFEVPYDIIVIRMVKEEYIPQHKMHPNYKSKSNLKYTTKIKIDSGFKPGTPKNSSKYLAKLSNVSINNSIPINAYYDSKGRLVEIGIVGSSFEIPRKVIIAFSLCIPFHPLLAKITIRKRGLKSPALYEISKLLSHSNITDVFFEDCYVPEGTYYLLLEHASHLKNLALRRLCLNDDACINIAKRLDLGEPASKTLLTLDLTSNNITDEGTRAFGDILRRNRCLLHLNLCDNNISDTGASILLNSLIAFPLTTKEIRDKKSRRFEYIINKIAVFKKHLEVLTRRQEEENIMCEVTETKDHKKIKQRKESVTKPEPISQLAEKLTQDEIGDLTDVFGYQHVGYIDKVIHCDGNLRLCSLNLSYNNLSNLSVRKIYEVLLYQRNIFSIYRTPGTTGLLRVFFEGNNLPTHCEETNGISYLLSIIISELQPSKCSSKAQSSRSVSRISSVKSSRIKKTSSILN